jgi:general secretion pathway protein M
MMIERLSKIHCQLSPRERFLLIFFVALVLPAALVWGASFPLMERRDAARAASATAYINRDWLSQMQTERESLLVQMKGLPDASVEPKGLSGLEASLVQAGLRDAVTSLGTPADDTVSLRFREVPFIELMAWLQNMEGRTGYRLLHLQLAQVADPGKVAAEVNLAPVAGDATF